MSQVFPRYQLQDFEASMTKIIYDDQCQLCRYLARLIEAKMDPSWQLEPYREFLIKHGDPALAEHPDELLIYDGLRILHGEEAWIYLVSHLPHLSKWAWIAERLGLKEASARQMRRIGHGLRRLCRQCGY